MARTDLPGSSPDHPWLLDARSKLVRPMRGLEGSSLKNPYVFDERSNLVLLSSVRAAGGIENRNPRVSSTRKNAKGSSPTIKKLTGANGSRPKLIIFEGPPSTIDPSVRHKRPARKPDAPSASPQSAATPAPGGRRMTTGVQRCPTTIRAAHDRANTAVPAQAVPARFGRRDSAGRAAGGGHHRASVMARMFPTIAATVLAVENFINPS
ncbi:hypothetical protein B0H13DRAFT_2359930 [Mycena leptocephala]|nr:hypothetical protein B0H13DRAFT_2359930 [Mycena leptocephala]